MQSYHIKVLHVTTHFILTLNGRLISHPLQFGTDEIIHPSESRVEFLIHVAILLMGLHVSKEVILILKQTFISHYPKWYGMEM